MHRIDPEEHISRKGKLKERQRPKVGMRLSTRRKAPEGEDEKPLQVKHRKFVASTNPPSESIMARFWKRKQLENEASREKRQCVEMEAPKFEDIPTNMSLLNLKHVEAVEGEPPNVDDNASLEKTPTEQLTRRMYKEIAET